MFLDFDKFEINALMYCVFLIFTDKKLTMRYNRAKIQLQ